MPCSSPTRLATSASIAVPRRAMSRMSTRRAPRKPRPSDCNASEDYGARERRELQANVFAREFLLPREQARRLFVDGRTSASAVAEQLDLPLPLVRQQILDVVLLPELKEQDAVTATLPRPVQLRSGAGSRRNSSRCSFSTSSRTRNWKNENACHKNSLLLEENIDPRSILVLDILQSRRRRIVRANEHRGP